MVDVNGLVNKVKKAVGENSDSIRSGLDKVERTINERTGDKYADKITKGRGGLEGAIGMPREAKNAYTEGADTPTERPDAVQTQPVDEPEPIADPQPLDRDGRQDR